MPDTDLTTRRCRPCDGSTTTLSDDEVGALLSRIEGWGLVAGHLERSFRFGNYHETIAFVNAVAWVAHQEGHHPDLEVGFRSCKVKYWTHAIDGLSENDFICAAKVSELLGEVGPMGRTGQAT